MFGEAELAFMRAWHRVPGSSSSCSRRAALADSYDDVSFTPPALGRIEAETLIVFGDRDPFYPVSLAFDLRAAIPRSRLWVVPDGGHAPVFGPHAPRFAETTQAFSARGVGERVARCAITDRPTLPLSRWIGYN